MLIAVAKPQKSMVLAPAWQIENKWLLWWCHLQLGPTKRAEKSFYEAKLGYFEVKKITCRSIRYCAFLQAKGLSKSDSNRLPFFIKEIFLKCNGMGEKESIQWCQIENQQSPIYDMKWGHFDRVKFTFKMLLSS